MGFCWLFQDIFLLTAHKTILCAVIRTDSVVLLSSHNMVYSVEINRVAMVREKYLEKEFFFQVREKTGYFLDGQGFLERIQKVKEFETK